MSVNLAVARPLLSLAVDVTGLAALLVLCAPVLLLVVAIVRAHRASARSEEPSEATTAMQRMLPDGDFSALDEPPVGLPAAAMSPAGRVSPAPRAEPDVAERADREAVATPAVTRDVAAPAAGEIAVAPAPSPASDWSARIAAAEAAGDAGALPELYLAYARAEIAQGSTRAAADHLRSAVGLAAKARNAPIQAEARLELAELAREAGDLTTACEHWQIARGLFREMKSADKLGETETLMQRHGCPTDWVLNDF